jgi:MFS family permease
MAFSARHPVWLPAAPKPTALAFAILFTIESLARASVATVVSVQAYDLLQSSQKVSLLFTAVGIVSLIGTLVVPLIIGRTARRFVYTFGAICLILAAAAFAAHTLPGQTIGMLIRVFGTACLNITTSLYILDHIRRHDLVRAEPMRLTYSTLSWTIGPALGVWLYTRYGVWAPQVFSVFWTLVLLALFWYLRLSESRIIQAARVNKPGNPLRNVWRFAVQPRLRLAWLIAFGRSCFWSLFFIYAPLLMITSGLGKEAGGILVSAGNAVLIFAMAFGKLSERFTIRRVIAFAFGVIGITTIAAGLAGIEYPYFAALMLLIAAIGATAVDGVGGLPFMRAVHYHERAEMAGVYRTYVDIAELIPTFIYSILLLFLPLGSVFVVMGAWGLVCGLIAWRYLPRSM